MGVPAHFTILWKNFLEQSDCINEAPSSGSMDIAIGQSNLTKLVNIKKGIRRAARDGEL